jgi:hypothetical protein
MVKKAYSDDEEFQLFRESSLIMAIYHDNGNQNQYIKNLSFLVLQILKNYTVESRKRAPHPCC